MMDTSCGNTGVNFADIFLIVMTITTTAFVVYQFRIGEASGKGGWVRKSQQPRRFAFMMGCWTFVAIIFALVSALDIYARIHHLPRCG